MYLICSIKDYKYSFVHRILPIYIVTLKIDLNNTKANINSLDSTNYS